MNKLYSTQLEDILQKPANEITVADVVKPTDSKAKMVLKAIGHFLMHELYPPIANAIAKEAIDRAIAAVAKK